MIESDRMAVQERGKVVSRDRASSDSQGDEAADSTVRVVYLVQKNAPPGLAIIGRADRMKEGEKVTARRNGGGEGVVKVGKLLAEKPNDTRIHEMEIISWRDEVRRDKPPIAFRRVARRQTSTRMHEATKDNRSSVIRPAARRQTSTRSHEATRDKGSGGTWKWSFATVESIARWAMRVMVALVVAPPVIYILYLILSCGFDDSAIGEASCDDLKSLIKVLVSLAWLGFGETMSK